MQMRKFYFTLFVVLFLASTVCQDAFAQQTEDVERTNNFLTRLYNSPFHDIDTSTLPPREQAILFTRADDSQMRFNGYTTLGILNLHKNNYNTSISNFKAALAIDSTCFICYYKLHWLYYLGKNDYTAAYKLRQVSNRIFERVLKTDTNDIYSWQKLYESLTLNANLPKPLKLRADYAAYKVVSLDSNNAYYWWQYSFHTGNDKQKHQYALEKAYQLEPRQAIYWNALANCYTELKNVDELKSLMENCRPDNDGDLHYWYQQKANYLYRLNLKTEALAVYNEAKSKGMTIVYKY
jgi:tetratricopeptide (TPR) repeat protein